VLRKTIEDLETKSQKLPQYKAELDKIEEAKPRLEAKEKAFEDKKQKRQDLLASIQQLKSEQEKLKMEIGEIDEKLNLLCKEGENKCPLCETALGEEGLTIIREKYGKDRNTREKQIAKKESEINNSQNEYKTIEQELAEEEKELKSHREWLQKRVGSLAQAIDDATEAENKLAEQRKLLNDVERKIKAKDYSPGEQQELKNIDDKITSLGYDADKHEAAKKNSGWMKRKGCYHPKKNG
jgi:DNA repair exonuclease SbcCD ATPase subunit